MAGPVASRRAGGPAPPARAAELIAATLGLSILGAAVFGPQVAGAPFLSDDWSNAAWAELVARGSLLDWLGALAERPLFAHRPLLALALAVPDELFGTAPAPHLVWGLGLGVAAAACLYAVLRAFGLRWGHAAAIAGLWLLFPGADSVRLWSTAAANNLAVLLGLGGLLLATRGLTAPGRRSSALHAGALLCYGASVLTYEGTAVALCGCGLLYATLVGWRRAVGRWLADLLAIGFALAWVLPGSPQPTLPLGEWLGRAVALADGAASLLARAAVPLGSPPRALVLAALATPLALAIVAGRGWHRTDPWLRTALAGSLVMVAAYIPFVPAAGSYQPLGPGLHNRVNLVASIGLVILLWSVLALAAEFLADALHGGRRVSVPALALVAVAFGAGYTLSVSRDAAEYRRAGALQDEELAAVRAQAGGLPRGAVLYVAGGPVYAAPGVPVLRHWDLTAAVALATDDPSVVGVPVYPGSRLDCARAGVQLSGPPARGRDPYARTFFLNARHGRLVRVRRASACRRERRSMSPGPWLAPATLTRLEPASRTSSPGPAAGLMP